MSTSKKILVIGTGFEQHPIILRAKERGYFVCGVDGNPHAYGAKLCDDFRTISVRNEQEIIAYAEEIGIDAVTSMITEASLGSVCAVAHHFGYPGIHELSVRITNSKFEMRQAFSGKIPGPRYVQTNQSDYNFSDFQFPVVMKPADRGGQVGLYKVTDLQELQKLLPTAISASVNGYAIVEEFMEGPELNGVAVVHQGRLASYILSDRLKHAEEAFGVVQRHSYPSAYVTAEIHDQMQGIISVMIDEMNIQNGILFPQFIVNQGQLKLVEVGERIPGGIMKELYEAITGVDLMDFHLDCALNQVQQWAFYQKDMPNAAASVYFLTANPGPLTPGIVRSIIGEERLNGIQGLRHFGLFQGPFDPLEIRSLRSGRDRFYYLVATGEQLSDAIEVTLQAANQLQFVMEE